VVYTREDFPQDWAMTQNNLGNASSRQASASKGAERARLLAEAVQAFRDALNEYTRDEFPQQWVMAKNNLGIALRDQALASEGAERVRLLKEAIRCFENSLTVYPQEHFPSQYEQINDVLSQTRHMLDEAQDQ